LRLARDLSDPNRYVSFGRWESADAAHAWKGSEEFPVRMARVQQHVAQFAPSELEIVAVVGEGAVTA
jgi:heme-degrading monooxygenase HmoA